MYRERTSLFAAVSSVVLMLELLMLLSASTNIAAEAASIADDSQLAVLTYLPNIANILLAFAADRNSNECYRFGTYVGLFTLKMDSRMKVCASRIFGRRKLMCIMGLLWPIFYTASTCTPAGTAGDDMKG